MASKKLNKIVIEYFLPQMIRYLVKKGLITEEDLTDSALLDKILRKHLKIASEQFSILISLHKEFADHSFELWNHGRKYPAIVLFATAVEQALNSHYRLAFLANNVSTDHISAIIKSQTLDAKLTWLMQFATKTKFPAALAKRLRIISEIRNSIVHYKAIPGRPDYGEDSYNAIEKRIQQLGRISLRRDFDLLQRFLYKTLMSHDPSFLLANKAAENLKSYWEQPKKSKEID